MKSPKVVFDTNIIISAIVFGGNPRSCLEMAEEGKIKLVTSKALLLELAEKLDKKFGMRPEIIERTIEGIGKFAEIVQPIMTLSAIKQDEPDNRVLEAAKEAKAEWDKNPQPKSYT